MGAAAFVQGPVDGVGKKVQTFENTLSGQLVEAQAVVQVDSSGAEIVTQPVSGTFWQATQPVSGTVTANAGSGPFPSSQSGTWTVQPGNTANTTAWKVDGSAVTQPVSGTFWQATQPVSGTVTATPTGTYTTKETRAATPAQTSVANSVTNVSLLASNANRLGATIFNDDTLSTGASLKVKLGSTASATSFTVNIVAQGYYEVPFNYTGAIDGIASAATGSARITELT